MQGSYKSAHFRDFLNGGNSSPGLFIVPQQTRAIGAIIEALLLAWACSQPDKWRDRIAYLP